MFQATRRFFSVSCALVLLASSGCAGQADNATIDEQLVKEQTRNSVLASHFQRESGGGERVALSLVATAMSAPALLQSKATQDQTKAANAAIDDFEPHRFAQYATGGLCSCSADGCSFQSCRNGAGVEITGDFSWSRDAMVCDYSARVEALGVTFALNVDCDLSFAEDQINGSLSSDGLLEGELQGELERATWSSAVSYDQVGFDRDRRLFTGTIVVQAAYEDTRGEDLSASATIELGD